MKNRFQHENFSYNNYFYFYRCARHSSWPKYRSPRDSLVSGPQAYSCNILAPFVEIKVCSLMLAWCTQAKSEWPCRNGCGSPDGACSEQ